MARLELEIEREIVADAGRVLDVLDDPACYPEWVATLRALEPGPDGTWSARAGYLDYERALELRRLPAPRGGVRWRGGDAGLEAGLDVTAAPSGGRRVAVRLRGFLAGGERILGLPLDHPLIATSLRLAAEHSLAQLERRAAPPAHAMAADAVDQWAPAR